MDATNSSESGAVLREWRTKILNVFLAIVAIAATAMTGAGILDAISRPGQWPSVIIFSILTLMLAALALLREIDSRIRAWGVLVVPYVVGVTTLASYGLGSSGRLYLLALPVGALILIGVRSGIIMSAISVLTMAAFTFLADRGMLLHWLIGDVCGKGVGAALFMTLFRSLIRATATSDVSRSGEDMQALAPAERLRHVISFTNRYLVETHSDAYMFATVFIGIFDLQQGALTYINCGNVPPLLLGRGGAVAAPANWPGGWDDTVRHIFRQGNCAGKEGPAVSLYRWNSGCP